MKERACGAGVTLPPLAASLPRAISLNPGAPSRRPARRFTLTFASCSDAGLFDPEVLQARRDKEAASLAQWRDHDFRSKTFTQLHSWLFLTHQCYSASRQDEFEKKTIQDPRLLASY